MGGDTIDISDDESAWGWRIIGPDSGETDDDGEPLLGDGQYAIASGRNPMDDGLVLAADPATLRRLGATLIARFGWPGDALADEVLVPVLERENAVIDPEDAPLMAAVVRDHINSMINNGSEQA